MWRFRPSDPPDPGSTGFSNVLLASEGRKIPDAAIRLAAQLARQAGGRVHVFSIARIWGTSLGMPAPGLLPTRREWDEQRENVAAAVKALERRKVAAAGQVVGTRHPGKRIVAEATRLGCEAIIMAAEAPRHWLVASLLWSQEPYRVRKRAQVPVYIVEVPEARPERTSSRPRSSGSRKRTA